MERDFMGLNSKDGMIVVKEEVVESSKDTGFAKASGIPWPSSSKVSALPHFMSLRAVQDEKQPKIVSDHLGSSGLMAMSSVDACDLNNKRQSADFQTLHSSQPLHDVKMLPYAMGNPFFKTHFARAGQNFAGATMKQQFLGGIPVTAPHSILPSSGFVAGTTDPRFNSQASGGPAQLTIFYAGTVNVYNDISPEKAQAIMFLAGNGCISNIAPQNQGPASKFAAGDGAFMGKTMNTPPCSALASPISVSSHPIGQSAVVSIDNDETKGSKAICISNTPISKVETPKLMTSLGPVPANTIMPSAVPQARKASLARFLEKRKERVMSSSPYHLSKKSADNTISESNFADYSATSGAGYNSVFTGKETNHDF